MSLSFIFEKKKMDSIPYYLHRKKIVLKSISYKVFFSFNLEKLHGTLTNFIKSKKCYLLKGIFFGSCCKVVGNMVIRHWIGNKG